MFLKVNADEITFGIEIECLVPSNNYAQVENAAAALNFTSVYDGSLRSESGYQAREYVSPVLKGKEGLDTVFSLLTQMQELGVKANHSCGTHVHVGTNNLFVGLRWAQASEGVSRIIRFFSQHETAFFGVGNRPSRLTNSYCASIKSDGKWSQQKLDDFGKQSTARNAERACQEGSRYYTLNTHNLFGSGTIEFRIFAGTVNPIKTVGYVMMAMGTVQRALEAGWVKKFDDNMTIGQFNKSVKRIHKHLNWTSYRKPSQNGIDQSHKCGVPTGAWEVYGKAVLKNQRSQSKRLDDRMVNSNNYPF